MDFNKIRKVKELKSNFNIFDYYKAQLGVFNSYESTLKLSETQKEELSKELCIKEIFNVKKRMIVFFSFKIKFLILVLLNVLSFLLANTSTLRLLSSD